MATENLKNAISKQKNAPVKSEGRTTAQLIEVMKPQIEKALPGIMTAERFARLALTAINSTPKLKECNQDTFLGALMQAAQLGLEPNTALGQAYLIPYGKNVQFQIGYKGLIDLAHRSGQFKTIYAREVYSADEFHYEYGLDPKLEHIPATENRGEVEFYYAVFTLTNGGFGFEVMSKSDVVSFAKKYSQAYKSGPWQTNFDEMAKKTLIKKVLKYAPIKTEFVREIATDETVKSKIEPNMVDAENEVEYEIVDDIPAGVNAETGEIEEMDALPFD